MSNTILAMVAGQLLDAAVATNVMEIEVKYEYSPSGPIYLDASTLLSGRYRIHSYSTNISSAWTVMEKMRSKKFRPVLNEISESSGSFLKGLAVVGDWHCNFMSIEGIAFRAYGKTAEEAICKAALMAVMDS